MHDADVRSATWDVIRRRKDSRDAMLLNEFGLCGEVRADIAVINGHMTGFELKSASDNLKRLPRQVEYYSKVLDYCNLVVAENHLKAAFDDLPDFWGVYVAKTSQFGGTYIREIRKAKINRFGIDRYCLVQLLWREEALHILSENGLDYGVRSKPRPYVWRRLADSFTINELRKLVRMQIKSRHDWRVDES